MVSQERLTEIWFLREWSGYPLWQCRAAISATEGDLEQSREYLLRHHYAGLIKPMPAIEMHNFDGSRYPATCIVLPWGQRDIIERLRLTYSECSKKKPDGQGGERSLCPEELEETIDLDLYLEAANKIEGLRRKIADNKQ